MSESRRSGWPGDRLRLGGAAALLLIFSGEGFAATPDPAKWSLELDPARAAPESKVVGRLQAQIEPGWHVYSLTTPKGGANPTRITVAPNPVVDGARIFQPTPKRAFDPNFNVDTESFEGAAVFLLEMSLKEDAPPGVADIVVDLRYQVCNDKTCINAKPRSVRAALTIDAGVKSAAAAIPAGYSEVTTQASAPRAGAVTRVELTQARMPVLRTQGVGLFLLTAFGLGLAAIFTPCVFPMIPITMSFFLNRQTEQRREGVVQAVIFCLGIIVLFSALGLIATAALGPFGVVQLSSNPWVNLAIAAIFLLFGLSLLGAFEITIPSPVLTRLDRASQGGGIAGTLLMGLTFSLASFACVGPFVGTLLAASVQGGGMQPLLGMVIFATGLALPFFLLALFPSFLKKMPKSGGWLSRVKVVMGFVVLAAMLKYLSSADQALQWNFLTRERFLAIWIVLFAMAGLYLLGFVRLEGITSDQALGIPRLLLGMIFLIFAISLIPGMFGARLGDLEAYTPPPSGPGAFSSGSGGESLAWMKNRFREALEKARREGKLVFVNFTGYACANCHWMKANMFTRPEIASLMKDFVLVDLYTDGTDQASKENQDLLEKTFATIAIPYYAIYTPEGKVVASFPGLTRNPQEFLAFLNQPAENKPGAVVAATDAPATLPLKSLDGAPFDSGSLAGKVVVLNFWATWCVPCIQEIPGFNKINDQLADKGVKVVGVSMDEDGAAVVKPFLKDHPMNYAVALASEQISKRFQVSEKLPVTVVLDRSGKAIQRFEGFTHPEAIEAAVKQAL